MAGLVRAHFREIPLPRSLSKELPQSAHVLEAYRLGQGEIYSGGVSLDTQGLHGLFQELLIQHKICTLHVYIVARYSYRSASTGAIRVALLAGYRVAMKLTKMAAAAIQMPSCQCGLKGT